MLLRLRGRLELCLFGVAWIWHQLMPLDVEGSAGVRVAVLLSQSGSVAQLLIINVRTSLSSPAPSRR